MKKSYDGLELPLGPAPFAFCGLKSFLSKEGRLVVPLAVSFCFFCVRMQIRYVGAPCMPPGYCQDLRKAKLPYRQLNTQQQPIVGVFTFFNTLQSHPAVVLYVYLLPKSAVRNAQHDLEGIL
jgi:hypothetical protein